MTEDVHSVARKGSQSRLITTVIAKVFEDASGIDMRVRRVNAFTNKFEDAEDLSRRYPEALPLLPKRPPIWLPEPRDMGYFDALALVDHCI